ncbi:SlyX family protein [Haemophilus influenzae]|uniref:SlyX family protein n=1 Tax=Haemophilus influenzae TaxID=727 RepID=UPI000588F9BA|nr:SlyX family protein [Haemophilus influenzae]KIG23363.1 protein SlyX-like protein [Haemophilus influenzae 60294N1]MCK8894642.1 SlyX family protein [Haemophilus influenzae]MCK9003124.1 SlyX family protein [Haemophilus influenzae]MCK9092827.1 SlyX family protein [Haemophilus influenzae]MCK9642474.1 SlyX family protein [Haemophilus influenzae]
MQIQQMLENRIEELEMKIAFQEQLLDELNHALVQQQFDIDKMQVQLRYMANKLKDFQPSNIASQSEETQPPHY